MHGDEFDALIQTLTTPRRAILSGALALAVGRLGCAATDARAKGKPKKPKPNPYGCLDVGAACKRADQCCSSLCEGKPGKKKCRAHDIGTCQQGTPGACTADNPELLHCGASSDCFCFRTTAGSNFCGDWFGGTKICHACSTDADCDALGLPTGSACVPVTNGNCAAANCAGGMMCMAPCGLAAPDPAADERSPSNDTARQRSTSDRARRPRRPPRIRLDQEEDQHAHLSQ